VEAELLWIVETKTSICSSIPKYKTVFESLLSPARKYILTIS
jgi:hypothetical protein